MALDMDKQNMITKIISAMQSEGQFIADNPNISAETKLSQMDVILDVVHFLKGYEKNTKILNQYEFEHRMERNEEDNER